MFVELGSTTQVWRAHIVRGILASFEIDAVVWHEHSAYIYGAGWGPGCFVLVSEDDADEALEILRAAPESEPSAALEPDQAHDTDPLQIYPGLVPLLVAGVMILLGFFACDLLLHFVISFLESGTTPPDPRVLEGLPLAFLIASAGGLGWGILVFLLLLMLRWVPELVKTVVGMFVLPMIIT